MLLFMDPFLMVALIYLLFMTNVLPHEGKRGNRQTLQLRT